MGETSAVVNVRQESFSIRKAGMHMSSVEVQLQTTSSKTSLESMMRPVGEQSSSPDANRGRKRRFEEVEEEEEDDQAHDEVRLWEDGFKDRYYESKFDVAPEMLQFR